MYICVYSYVAIHTDSAVCLVLQEVYKFMHKYINKKYITFISSSVRSLYISFAAREKLSTENGVNCCFCISNILYALYII
jgi:hypothetical protein